MTDLGRMLLYFAIVTAALLVVAVPLFLAARKRSNTTAPRGFAWSALAIGAAYALLTGVSERQVRQCLEAGNPDCIDYGTSGLQMLLIGIYAVVAWTKAYYIWRD